MDMWSYNAASENNTCTKTLRVLIYEKSNVDITVSGIFPKHSHNMLLKGNG